MKHKLIVCIRNITEKQKDDIRSTAESRGWTAEIYDDKAEALEASHDAEVVFADTPRYVLHAPDLKWMISPSAGVNHFIKNEAFLKSGVMLSNSSGAYGVTIAEHIVMQALFMLRMMPEYQKAVKNGEWVRGYTLKSIKDSRITLLGTGDIGCETAKRLRAFDPGVITGVNTTGSDPMPGLFDRTKPIDDIDSILPDTDILIMSLPFTPKTYHILDEKRLGMLPQGSLVINVGRGVTIDEEALKKELKAGRLRAALDVFEKEPIPEGSDLWDMPNLLITPHVAGDMFLPYTVQRIVDLFIQDFIRYTQGERPLRLVDPKKGY